MKKTLKVNFNKSYSLTIPAAINTNELLANNPPKTRGINEDSINYLLHIILRKMQSEHRLNKNKREGFVPLKAEYIRNITPNFENTKRYLMELNIIESDNYWKRKLTSIGFRINRNYLDGNFKIVNFIDYKKKDKFEMKYGKSIESENHFKFSRRHILLPMNNKSIAIDEVSALNSLEKICSSKVNDILKNKQKKPPNVIDIELSDVEHFKKTQTNKIFEIKNGICGENNRCSFDVKGQRFHSAFTSLKSELREFITIDKEQISIIDLKNSQPFLLLLFANKNFYNHHKKPKIMFLGDIDREYYRNINKSHINIPYMMLNSKFKELASQGMLYEYLIEDFKKINKEDNINVWNRTRKSIKKSFIAWLYDCNRGNYFNDFSKYLNNNFPELVEVITFLKSFKTGNMRKVQRFKGRKLTYDNRGRQIKSDDNSLEVDDGFTKLATTLQRIESSIFLDRICKRLSRQYSNINYFTIHDSIACASSKKEIVYSVIEEEIIAATDIKPMLDIKDYSIVGNVQIS